MNTIREGDVVAERFEIERRAAAGGMGTIFRARDRVGGEIVALKVMLEALHASGDLEAARAAIDAAAERLHAWSSKTADPSLRRSFLENVPNNARTVALAKEWGTKKE